MSVLIAPSILKRATDDFWLERESYEGWQKYSGPYWLTDYDDFLWFFFGELFLLVLCLNYAVRLSRLTLHVKLLAQEVALLRAQLGDGGRAGGSGGTDRGPSTALGAAP